MPRDTLVSWRTFALLVLLPPVGIAVLVLSPLLSLLVLTVYAWGRYRERRRAADRSESPRTVQPQGETIREAYE